MDFARRYSADATEGGVWISRTGRRGGETAIWRSEDATSWHSVAIPSEIARNGPSAAIVSGPQGLLVAGTIAYGAKKPPLWFSGDGGRTFRTLAAPPDLFAETPWGPVQIDSLTTFRDQFVIAGGTPLETSNTPSAAPTVWFWRPARARH